MTDYPLELETSMGWQTGSSKTMNLNKWQLTKDSIRASVGHSKETTGLKLQDSNCKGAH